MISHSILQLILLSQSLLHDAIFERNVWETMFCLLTALRRRLPPGPDVQTEPLTLGGAGHAGRTYRLILLQLTHQPLVLDVELLALFAPAGVFAGELEFVVEGEALGSGLVLEVGEEGSPVGLLKLLLLPEGRQLRRVVLLCGLLPFDNLLLRYHAIPLLRLDLHLLHLGLQLLDLPVLLLYLLLLGLHEYLELGLLVLDVVEALLEAFQFETFAGEFFLDAVELAADQYLAFGLRHHHVLYLVELPQLLLPPELLGLVFEPPAAHPEEVEQSHLVDELGGVVGVEQHLRPQLTSLQVLRVVLLPLPALPRPVLAAVVLIWDAGGALGLVGGGVEGNAEFYFFVKQLVDLLPVVVDDVEVLVLGGLLGVDHVQVLDLGEDLAEFLVLPLQLGYLLLVLDLHRLAHAVLQPVHVVLHSQQLVLDQGLLVQQFGHLAQVLGLQQLVVLVLEVADECGLLVDEFVLVVDGLQQHLVVLREGLDPVLELLLREGEQQLVHVVHAVLEVRNGDNEAVAGGEQVDPGDLVAESVDEGLQEGQLVLLADVGLAVAHQRARVARNQVHPRDQTRVYDPLGLALGHPLRTQQPDRLRQHAETQLLPQQLEGQHLPDDAVVLVVHAALVAPDQRHLPLRKLHLVLLPVALQVLEQAVRVDLVYLLELHVGLLEATGVRRQPHTGGERDRRQDEHLLGNGQVQVGSLGRLAVGGRQGGSTSGQESIGQVEVVSQPGEHLQSVVLPHRLEQLHPLPQEAAVVLQTGPVRLLLLEYQPVHEASEVVRGQGAQVLHAVHQHTGVSEVDAVVEALLLLLVLRHEVGDVDPGVGVEGRAVVLEAGRVGEPLVEGVVVGVEVVGVLVDAVEVGLVDGQLQQPVDVVGLGPQELRRTAGDVLEQLEVVAERQVRLPDQSVALYLAHHEVDDLVVDHPVLLLVGVPAVSYLLRHLLAELFVVDDEAEHNRQVLVVEGVDGFADAVLVGHEVALLEVDLLADDVLEGVEHLLLDLQRYHQDVGLDVLHQALVVLHEGEVLVAGRFGEGGLGVAVGLLGEFAGEGVHDLEQVVDGVALVGVSVQVGDAEGPLEDVLLARRRIQIAQHQLAIELLHTPPSRRVVLPHPLLQILLGRHNVVHVLHLPLPKNRLLQTHHLLWLPLVVQDLTVNQLVLRWHSENGGQERHRNSIVIQLFDERQRLGAHVQFVSSQHQIAAVALQQLHLHQPLVLGGQYPQAEGRHLLPVLDARRVVKLVDLLELDLERGLERSLVLEECVALEHLTRPN